MWVNPNQFNLLRAFEGNLVFISISAVETDLADLFKNACNKVGTEGRARTEIVKHYMFYRLLLEQKYLNDSTFRILLEAMVENGTIISVMRGRDSRIQSVTLRS